MCEEGRELNELLEDEDYGSERGTLTLRSGQESSWDDYGDGNFQQYGFEYEVPFINQRFSGESVGNLVQSGPMRSGPISRPRLNNRSESRSQPPSFVCSHLGSRFGVHRPSRSESRATRNVRGSFGVCAGELKSTQIAVLAKQGQ